MDLYYYSINWFYLSFIFKNLILKKNLIKFYSLLNENRIYTKILTIIEQNRLVTEITKKLSNYVFFQIMLSIRL